MVWCMSLFLFKIVNIWIDFFFIVMFVVFNFGWSVNMMRIEWRLCSLSIVCLLVLLKVKVFKVFSVNSCICLLIV